MAAHRNPSPQHGPKGLLKVVKLQAVFRVVGYELGVQTRGSDDITTEGRSWFNSRTLDDTAWQCRSDHCHDRK